MVKFLKYLYVAMMFSLVAPTVSANGAYTPGHVGVGTRFDGGATLGAFYNVRYNPAASSMERVSMTFYRGANSVIAITGADAASRTFVCYITPANNPWEVALEGMRAAGNGATIQAATPPGSANCDTFVFHKTSDAQD